MTSCNIRELVDFSNDFAEEGGLMPWKEVTCLILSKDDGTETKTDSRTAE